MALAKVKKQLTETATTEYNSSHDEEVSEEDGSTDEQPGDMEDTESDSDNAEGNAGWADSIAKVLSTTKPKTKNSVVLSRAKKIQPGKETVKKEKSYGFEIEGELKEEKPDKEELKANLKQRKNIQLPLRVRPTWKDIERERTLRKIGTKGVVQLFNAVRMQQKDLEQQLEKAGPLESRKDAVLNNINKKKFLDVLMSGSRAKSEAVDNSVKVEDNDESSSSDDDADDDDDNASDSGKKRKSQWDVLRPDYMTNKKIKHWDEEDDDDDNSDENQNQSNDDSSDDDENDNN